jgi:site-specific recombinase XerC
LKKYLALFCLKNDDFIFFSSSTQKHKPITRQWAHRIIASEARKMNLCCIGSHSMRKIYACNLYQSTGDLNAVQRALNHKYPSTTLLYLRDLLPASCP